MAKFSGKGFGNFFGLLRFVFTLKGAISFALILVVISLFGHAQAAYQEKDVSVFFRGVGGEVFSFDQNLYDESVRIGEDGVVSEGSWFGARWWSAFLSVGLLLKSLWYLYTWFLVFYWFSSTVIVNNTSAKFSNILLSVIFLCVLIIGYNFIVGNGFIVPFRGVISFVGLVVGLFGHRGDVLVNESVNATDFLNSSDGSLDFVVDMIGD